MFTKQGSAEAGSLSTPTLQIDIPVVLERAMVVYNIDHLLLWGDASFAVVHMRLLMEHFHENGTNGDLIAIFHSDAGHVTLDDQAYNSARVVSTGNPFKAAIATLIGQGAHVELCGATAAANHWTNDDLLPGV